MSRETSGWRSTSPSFSGRCVSSSPVYANTNSCTQPLSPRAQFESWLVAGVVLSLDMTLSTIGSGPGEFLEIWRFGIHSHPPDAGGKSSMFKIDTATLSSEMSGLLRSIEQSCSFLVGVPPNCKFDIDVYCDTSASTSESWTHTTGNLLAVEKTSGRTIKV
jgi:hypothetical protein